MSKQTLPVNFRDDIMNASMNGKRRYNLIPNADGTYSLEDATTYDQVGSNFGAGQINATNDAVNKSADASKIIDSADAVMANTQEGYMAGALAVKELTGITKAILTAGETTVTISNSRITTDSAFSFYSGIRGVDPTDVSVAAGSVTLTFDAQETDMEVGVRVDG